MNNDGEVRIGTKLDNSGFERGAKELKKEAQQVDKEVTQVLSKSSQSTKTFGNALGGVAKKAVNLGSALFDVVAVGGLLGAVGLGAFILSKALDKANGSTEQLKTNLSYIGFVASKIFENLLQPAIDKTTGAINGLVGALYKAVVYIGYILSKWTGKDLFAGTSVQDYAKSMESANKSAKGTAKATKQIKKDLMGFDEVNKLSENASTGGTGGVGGVSVKTPNLPNLGDVKIPKWVEWIANHKDVILKVVGALLTLLTFSKVISWLAPLKSFFDMLTGSSGASIVSNLGGIGGKLGIIAVALGVISWAIGKSVNDMKETYGDAKDRFEEGTKELKNWLKGEHSVEEIEDRLNVKKKSQVSMQKENAKVTSAIYHNNKDDYDLLKKNLSQQDMLLSKKIELWRQGKLTKEQEQELISQLKQQKQETYDIAKNYEQAGINTSELQQMSLKYDKVLGEMGVKIQQNNKYMDVGVDGVDRFGVKMGQNKTIVSQVGQALNSNIKNATGETDSWYKKTISVFDKVKEIAGTKIPKKTFEIDTKVNTGGIGTAVNTIGKSIGEMISKVSLKSLFDDLEKKFPNGFSIMGVKMFDFKKIRKSLGLRQGGIINNPGRGVALGGNIIGGEAGSEAVLPLDDTTMDRLGSAIARHMNVSLTNVTEMNGRTISRELKTIMNESNFTYNG